MPHDRRGPRIPLPKSWHRHVRSAVVHVISLAQFSAAHTRGWAVNSVNARIRLKAEVDRLKQEVALLREETRIKDARMMCIVPNRRPYYAATERMAILELRAARGWSMQQTADVFLLTVATIASWMKRLDEEGREALVRTREPVNKFPDFVRYMIQRLRALCPTMGKVKIAQILARAGLHLGPTTIGRILKEKPAPWPASVKTSESISVVTATRTNQVWHIDLTTVPTGAGFWCSWAPFALPQSWPFCWWVGVIVDHFSRRVMGFTLFLQEPTSQAVRAFLGRAQARSRARPRHLICDKGPQFWCEGFKLWCQRAGVRPRFGAIGKHGSIAVIERAIRTMKELLGDLPFVPLRREAFRHDLAVSLAWYNEHRPHMRLDGATPNEVYVGSRPANRLPRWEPRPDWPRASPCSKPGTLVKGQPGARLRLEVQFHKRREHLPVLQLKHAA